MIKTEIPTQFTEKKEQKLREFQFVTRDGLIISVAAESFVEAARIVREAYSD